jgi:DNA-binding NtrC family response regulator
MTPSHSSATILLAHESAPARALIAEKLTAAGYAVAEADHLDQGFDVLYGLKPALAIINARMPDRAALKLAMAAKARGMKLLVIDDHAAPHETSPSIRAFTDARVLQRRTVRARVVQATQALVGPPPPQAEAIVAA